MKALFKNTKTNLLVTLSLLLVSSLAQAKSPKARVDHIVGNAFVTQNGTTKLLKKGDHLFDMADVTTEEGALVTFTNFFDQQYHLSGGGHVKVMNQIVELKRGYIWLESMGLKNVASSVQTPNSIVTYKKGEAIISFDQFTGKTQILSIKGKFSFKNIFQEHLGLDVPSGEFSFISKDYENGAPRRPTPVGKSTFSKITGLFSEKPVSNHSKVAGRAMDIATESPSDYFSKRSGMKRDIASVGNNTSSSKNEGRIIYVKKKKSKKVARENKMLSYMGRKLASLEKYKPKKRVFRPDYSEKSGIKVNIYGRGLTHKTSRKPASVVKRPSYNKRSSVRGPASVSNLPSQVEMKRSIFESSLMKEYKKQMRHSKEVNNLIQDLKNYDMDYKQAY